MSKTQSQKSQCSGTPGAGLGSTAVFQGVGSGLNEELAHKVWLT